jgi:hypothetical protein
LKVKDTYYHRIYVRRNTIKKKIVNFGSAYPIQSEDEVKLIIDGLRKKHPHAGHFVMYQIGTDTISYRANDDENQAIVLECLFMDKYFPSSQTHL